MEVAPGDRVRFALGVLVLVAATGSLLAATAGRRHAQWTDPTQDTMLGAPRGTGLGAGQGTALGGSRGMAPPLRKPTEDAAKKTQQQVRDDFEPIRVGDVPVAEVRIVGNAAFRKEAILPYIRTRQGRPFRMATIEKDVRQLYKTGMFVTVEPMYEDTPAGRVVIFKVVERPTLREVLFVRQEKLSMWDSVFSSVKKQEEKLQKKAGLSPGDPADPFRVEEARRALEDYYREKGYASVRVTVEEGNKPEDRRAVFVIHEGPKEKIVWTRFVGNTIASDARLLTQVESKQGILWIFKGEFDRKKLEADEETLTAYYRSLGFFHARVGHDVQFVRAPFPWNEPRALVTFVIDEGPRWKIREVSVIGNTKIAASELQESMKLHTGDFFNQNAMNSDIRKIREEYGGIGHVFADVKAEPRFLEEPGQMDLVYNIGEGDRYRIGRVNAKITGDNPHTKITALLNPLPLVPGDIVDTREFRATETRYLASQVFNVDRQRGNLPKIVFDANDALDKDDQKEPEKVARQPQAPPDGYRGQSPDDGWGAVGQVANLPRTGQVAEPAGTRQIGNLPHAGVYQAGYAAPAPPRWVFLGEPRFELDPPSWQSSTVDGPSPYRQDGGTR